MRWVARSPAWLEPGLAESPSRSIRPEARGARPGSAPLEKAPRQTPARTQLVPTRVAHSPAWQGVARAVRESISLWIDSLFLGSGPLRGADTYASSHADWRVSQCASMAASEQRESPGPPEAAEIGPDNRDNGCVWGGKSFGLQTTAPVTSRPPFLPSPGRCWLLGGQQAASATPAVGPGSSSSSAAAPPKSVIAPTLPRSPRKRLGRRGACQRLRPTLI